MALWTMTDEEAGKPKYLSDTLRNGQSVSDKDSTVGVDAEEAAVADNRAKGIKTPGWVQYRTYTDAQGNTRHKAEILVAGGSMSGDSDALPPSALPVITIGTQPVAQSVTEGDPATFSVTASVTEGATLSYLWEVSIDEGATWSTATGAVATNSSFTIDPTEIGMDGHQYRVVVSATGGATSVTSTAVTLSVAAAG